jgi:hypothetical protein
MAGCSLDLIPAPADMLHLALPEALPYIRQALPFAGGVTDEEHMISRLYKDEFKLWTIYEREAAKARGAVVTGFVQYDTKFVLDIIALACTAPREQWSQLRAPLFDWAQAHGATGVEASGRAGWLRALTPIGFKLTEVKMTMELNDAGR